MRIDLGLTFYPDNQPGILRRRQGRGFSYVAPDGTRIDNAAERARLEAMAVPPAYENVWMTPIADGHLWATGRDARNRKQYRYHPDWRAARDATKFDGLGAFGAQLPKVRRWIATALEGPPGTFDTAMGLVLGLIDRASLRVGSESYVRENKTYGATTLRARDVTVAPSRVSLDYRGKGGDRVRKTLHGAKLQRAIHRCADLPGAELATWIDEGGNAQAIRSDQVNERIGELCDGTGTAKTFRTWNGTLAAFRTVLDAEAPTIKDASEAAAAVLHNTAGIARQSYIHPDIIDLVGASGATRAGLRRSHQWEGSDQMRAGEAVLIGYLS
jgi:DNA topoisomerase-1